MKQNFGSRFLLLVAGSLLCAPWAYGQSHNKTVPGGPRPWLLNPERIEIPRSSEAHSYPHGQGRFCEAFDRFDETRFFKMTRVAVPLIVAGAAINSQRHTFRNLRNTYTPNFQHSYDDYLQYAPAAVMVGLKVAGVQGRSSWGRMLASDALSVTLMATMVNGLKYTVRQPRPDGSGHNSFPSGHTATAFMTAAMLHKEYGLTRSPWYSIGGYTAATVVGLSRLMNDRHWLPDVLTGAGIGILSTELGYYLADLIYRDRGMLREERNYDSFDYARKSSFLSLYMGFEMMSGAPVSIDAVRLHIGTGASAGVEGAWFWNRHFGIGARVTLASLPITLDRYSYLSAYPEDMERIDHLSTSPLKTTQIMIGPYFSYPLTNRWLIGSKIVVGYYGMQGATINLPGHESGTDPMSTTFSVTNSTYVSADATLAAAVDQRGSSTEATLSKVATLESTGRFGIGTGISLSYLTDHNFAFRIFYDCNYAPAGMRITTYDRSGVVSSSSSKNRRLASTLGGSVCLIIW